MAKYRIYDFLKFDTPVTQGYGANPDYYKQFGLKGHEGVDFGTINGTELFAPFDGVVAREDAAMPGDKDYGIFIVIRDPKQKIGMWFCHLQDVTKQEGDVVKQGELIGHTNNTGNTTGPHVHVNFVETDANGVRLNMDNGMQGFLDLMDPNLVEYPWQPLTVTIHPAPQVATVDAAKAAAPVVPAGPTPPPYPPNTVNQTVEYNGSTWKGQPGQGWTLQVAVAPIAPNVDDLKQQLQEAQALAQAKSQELTEVNKSYSGFVALGYNNINDVQKALDQKDEINKGLQNEIISLKKQNKSISDAYNEATQEDTTAVEMGMKAADELKTVKKDYENVLIRLGVEKPDPLHVLTHIDQLKILASKAVPLLKEKYLITQTEVQKFNEKGSGWLQGIAKYFAIAFMIIGAVTYLLIGRGWH